MSDADDGLDSERGQPQPNPQPSQPDPDSLNEMIRDWLRSEHADEVAAFADRVPDGMWICLSAASLKNDCDSKLYEDLLHQPYAVENGTAANGFDGIKRVVVTEADVSVPPEDLTIRWVDFPAQRLVGEYRAAETEQLLSVEGQIEQATGVTPVVSTGAFECLRCGTLTYLEQTDTTPSLRTPTECHGCEREGPFDLDKTQSEFIDYQRIRLQTPPEHGQDGVENLTVSVTGSLAGEYTGAVGRKAVITGYLTTRDTGDWERPFMLRARSIELVESEDVDIEAYRDTIDAFESLQNPVGALVDSRMLPDMYAPEGSQLRRLKYAVLLQACSPPRLGGSQRGDVHVFACGDPSTGKTAVAELAEQIVPRSEFVSTRVTGVGLTAAAVNDDRSGWMIKSGAIVRANNGVLVIDELDKIDNEHVNALHSPMERQRVSPSIADQSVTLPAETSVLATANPKYGRFDEYEPIGEQLDIPPTLLSRFDLIFTMTDRIDETRDQKMAEAITDGFQSAIDREFNSLEQDGEDSPVGFLRAWVAEARTYEPEFPDDAAAKLREFFVSLRQDGNGDDSPVPVTARQLEGLHRLAMAHARARHAEVVASIDVRAATSLVRDSLRNVGIDPDSGELDVDMVETTTSEPQRSRISLLVSTVDELEDQHSAGAPRDRIIEELNEAGIERETAEGLIETQLDRGIIYETETNHFRLKSS